MTLAALTAFLAKHGLLLLLPLAVIEGPIVSVLAGIMCGNGLMSWGAALTLLVAGDLIGDLVCYAVGWFSGGWLHRTGIRLGLPVAQAREWTDRVGHNAPRMLLIGKWTHAVGAAVLIAAGAARISIARFLAINLLATLPKSALLLGLGALAGRHWGTISGHLVFVAPVLLVIGGLLVWLVLRRRPATNARAVATGAPVREPCP